MPCACTSVPLVTRLQLGAIAARARGDVDTANLIEEAVAVLQSAQDGPWRRFYARCMRFFILACLALVTGCASATYDFDPTFTPNEEAAIMTGFAEWDGPAYAVKVVRLDANLTSTSDCPSNPGNIDHVGDTWTDAHPESTRTVMCLHMDRLAAYTAGHQHAKADDLAQVSAHEYGHVMGLVHSDDSDPASIMRPSMADANTTPTAWDLKNAKSLR